MLELDIPITPRKGHIIVGARQKPVMMRNVMEFGYLMNKFGRDRIVDERTEKHGVALVLEPTESQNFLLGSSRQFVGYEEELILMLSKQWREEQSAFIRKWKISR